MVGGGGERKTLRLVAQYADACNVFGDPQRIHHKYEVLREHCEAIGRDPDEIERSTLQSVKLAVDGKPGDSPAQVVDWFGELGDAGAQHVIFGVRDVWDPRVLEELGTNVIPGIHALPERQAGCDAALAAERRPDADSPGCGVPSATIRSSCARTGAARSRVKSPARVTHPASWGLSVTEHSRPACKHASSNASDKSRKPARAEPVAREGRLARRPR